MWGRRLQKKLWKGGEECIGGEGCLVKPRKHGSPSETKGEYWIGHATFFKVTKPLVYPVCGHRLVGILLSARVYKLRSGANNVIKNFPASNLSTLLRVFAGRLRWVAVLRPSQPWSRPTKNWGGTVLTPGHWLCYVMLCYVMLCYVIVCYVMLCYVMFCHHTSSCVMEVTEFTVVTEVTVITEVTVVTKVTEVTQVTWVTIVTGVTVVTGVTAQKKIPEKFS